MNVNRQTGRVELAKIKAQHNAINDTYNSDNENKMYDDDSILFHVCLLFDGPSIGRFSESLLIICGGATDN